MLFRSGCCARAAGSVGIGDVSRAKLYYLRELSGKAARIKERLEIRSEDVMPPAEPEKAAAEAKQ